MLSQSCAMIATIIVVVSHIIVGVNSFSEADKISTLPGQPQVKFLQYAGYITVDEEQQRALFYYFAEAEVEPASKPLVLWLNGGPGCSSVGAGAFVEHGPFKPSENGLVKNDYSWNKEANMLYLESPAGVGFSYSTNKSFYGFVNDEMTAKDNLIFLQHWFTKFPEYTKNDFFITGESYAGHYVPQLAQLIVQTKTKFNLKGIAIGNPLLEFNTDFNSRAEFFWSHGLISDSTFEIFTRVCNYSQIRRQLQSGTLSAVCAGVNKLVSTEVSRYVDSYDVTLDVCLSSADQQAYVLNQLTQLQGVEKIDVCVEDETITYLNRKDVQEALHAKLVGINSWSTCSRHFPVPILYLMEPCHGNGPSCKEQICGCFSSWQRHNNIVGSWLLNSFSKEITASVLYYSSAAAIWSDLEEILQSDTYYILKYDMQSLEVPTISILGTLVKSGIRVLVYSGDQDSVIPLLGTRSLVNGLAKEFGFNTTVSYRAWFEGRQVAGWTQVYGNILSFATIRGAAHEAPFSQPERSLVMLKAFLEGKPLPEVLL